MLKTILTNYYKLIKINTFIIITKAQINKQINKNVKITSKCINK